MCQGLKFQVPGKEECRTWEIVMAGTFKDSGKRAARADLADPRVRFFQPHLQVVDYELIDGKGS